MKMTTIQPTHLPQGSFFLLGFSPFFRKEIQEWQRKRAAIALLIFLPLLFNVITSVGAKLLSAQTGRPLPPLDTALAASVYSNSSIWTVPVAILLSIGLIPKELEAGTLSWNLTKPLSRASFLLCKWLSTTLMIWLVAVVLANFSSLLISAITLGWKAPNLGQLLAAQVTGFCAVGFWVLLCLFLGMLLKDQAAIATGAIFTAAAGSFLFISPIEQLKPYAPFFPSNTVDWLISENHLKLLAYLVYMAGMAIAAKWIFDRKEFS